MPELKLRPHHGMCMAFFQGKGYSEDFVRHMTATLERLSTENPIIELTDSADEICTHCPNLINGVCAQQESVSLYDSAVLERCGMTAGERLHASEFRRKVREQVLDAGHREDICGDCQWNSICAAASN